MEDRDVVGNVVSAVVGHVATQRAPTVAHVSNSTCSSCPIFYCTHFFIKNSVVRLGVILSNDSRHKPLLAVSTTAAPTPPDPICPSRPDSTAGELKIMALSAVSVQVNRAPNCVGLECDDKLFCQ